MRKETKNWLLEGTLDLLSESETLFVYVVVPLLCIIGVYIAVMPQLLVQIS